MICESYIKDSPGKCRERALYQVESFPDFGAVVCTSHLSVVMQRAKRQMGRTEFKVTIFELRQ